MQLLCSILESVKWPHPKISGYLPVSSTVAAIIDSSPESISHLKGIKDCTSPIWIIEVKFFVESIVFDVGRCRSFYGANSAPVIGH